MDVTNQQQLLSAPRLLVLGWVLTQRVPSARGVSCVAWSERFAVLCGRAGLNHTAAEWGRSFLHHLRQVVPIAAWGLEQRYGQGCEQLDIWRSPSFRNRQGPSPRTGILPQGGKTPPAPAAQRLSPRTPGGDKRCPPGTVPADMAPSGTLSPRPRLPARLTSG